MRACLAVACALVRAWHAAAAVTRRPHIVFVLVDDWGWNNAGYHRPGDPEVVTPNVDRLVREGIELDRHYVYHYCSPSRSSLQSGRLPVHVSYTNDQQEALNPDDPVSGYAGIPRNMTGLAEKLRQGGYRTHATGKWDAGMATWEHTPLGRGYETWFGYFHHGPPWSTSLPPRFAPPVGVDLEDPPSGTSTRLSSPLALSVSGQGMGFGLVGHANDYWTQRVASGGPTGCGPLVDLWNSTGPARERNGTAYEEEMFTDHTLATLQRHDPSEPLFLFHAFHQIHTPLQVPEVWERNFSFLDNRDRRKYAAMVHYMDTALGKIVAKIKEKGMWENTLMVVSSDNGGPVYYIPKIGVGGASNLPLRGGKLSDWEGGVRANAFVAGGAVPRARRGTVLSDYIHVSDWYATFCAIAGVDSTDHRAALAGLPPVDGLDHSALLLGEAAAGTRTEIHHSVRALTRGRWKLITGGLMDLNLQHPWGTRMVPYPLWANGWGVDAVENSLAFHDCHGGCLFDILADPNERKDVRKENSDVLRDMMARLEELNRGVFLPQRGVADPRACTAWDGFYGPFAVGAPPAPRASAAQLLV